MGYTDKHLDELKAVVKASHCDLYDVLAHLAFNATLIPRLNRAHCDLYDVLAHLAFNATLIPRLNRAQRATVEIADYSKEQKEFLDFILSQYVEEGYSELASTKLPQLLELRYGGVRDAIDVLGNPDAIKSSFEQLQQHLYA